MERFCALLSSSKIKKRKSKQLYNYNFLILREKKKGYVIRTKLIVFYI